MWYGIEKEGPDYLAKNVASSASGTEFDFYYKGQFIKRIKTHLLGSHNVSNALAAITLSHQAGLDWDEIQEGLLKFQGVGRRLEKLFEEGRFVVFDDYGHHPTEIKATISTLRKVDSRKICVVFEPHRFSRTQNFWLEFQDCFKGADEIFISPIYAASEKPIPGISSENLVDEMRKRNINVSFLPALEGMKDLVLERKNQELVFVTLGAGAISKRIRDIVKTL
jgi:UDP-N-acetylmuramate--alanine ligase